MMGKMGMKAGGKMPTKPPKAGLVSPRKQMASGGAYKKGGKVKGC